MQRREKKFSHFSDNGAEFKDKEDYKLSDLDVFGPKSLYQYLSEAKTPLGRSMLANQLKNPIKMEDGLSISTNPSFCISNMPISLVEPNLFFTPRKIL